MYAIIKSVIVLAMVLFAIYFAGTRFRRLFAMINSGKDEKLTDNPGQRIMYVVSLVFGHKKVLEDPISGFFHFFFLYGFFTLGIGHTELAIHGLTAFFTQFQMSPFLYENFLPEALTHIYHFTQDTMAFAVVFFSMVALLRRWSGKVERLMPRSMDAELILWFIIALYVTFFIFVGADNASRMANETLSPQWHGYIPFSSLLALGLMNLPAGALSLIYEFGFYSHLFFFLAFGCYIPVSKHMHLVFAGPNIYFLKKDDPVGLPPKIDFMDETLEKYGIDRVTEYSWKTLLDTFACTECGRCNSVCPAHTTGKPLQPKKVLHDLKVNLRYKNFEEIETFRDKWGRPVPDKAEAEGAWEPKVPLINRDEIDHDDAAQVSEAGKYLQVDGQVHLDELWGCTTCGACVDACPVLIDSVPGSLIALRQNLVMMEADFPEELTAAFKGLENQGNPWGVGQDKRADWTEELEVRTMAEVKEENAELEVDYLFWVGCAGSTDDRAKKTQKALVRILKASGVDFAILGCEEKCTGDPARRMGNEYVFDMLAQENVATLEQYRFKKIFTTCPHCFNSLANEYPEYGAQYSVQHHTELLQELLKDKRIPLSTKAELKEHITFHDPCYLSRYNQKTEESREVLEELPGVTLSEMDRNKSKSFCCGAGGGRMWMEEPIGKRVNVERTEEALVTLGRKGSDEKKTIAVGCPFCMTMITDGTKALNEEDNVNVRDIAEVIADRLDEAPPA
jgi:Fe-S oxidoreductase